MTLRRGAVATALLGATGCAVGADPAGMIRGISPEAAFDDAPFTMMIDGGPFRAAYRIDTATGNSARDVAAYSLALRRSENRGYPTGDPIPATSVFWVDEDSLIAEVPAGAPSGRYDVELRDPRANVISCRGCFTSLGPDPADPSLTLTDPPLSTLLSAEANQTFRFDADDGLGWLADMRWRVWTDESPIAEGNCAVPSERHAETCAAEVTLPATTLPVDVLHLEMMVTDRAAPNPHLLLKQVSFSFAPKPAVDSCSPLSGPAAGGTVVAISGTNFVPTQPGIATETGTEVLLRDDLGATVLPQGDPANGKMITVRVPPHPPGQVTLLVRNGPATDATSTACTFTYLPAPRVRLVTPAAGPASGGTRVTINGNHFLPGARVSLVGDVDGGLLCAVRVSDQRIDAVMPPGRGAVAFVVDTGIAGQSPAYAGFVYDEAAPSEPGPPTCTGGGAP